ncbi:glycosyltransferase family 2 protein [Salegentibacter sp. LM13S]|uniref:glycosyltransferase family 2 protein n=1 Tax=Salegentibacter lacus TaxID=2873599 RepID=UPI001CCA6A03|nr:glycosyltransferase family 2 protein [Salegentibacter lacus]MBZ9632359.1 glycosyltransferase family 2 protein [Salegentibacter lacus]
MRPEGSIIMATYNRAHLISESLLAIKAQTFTNWECIIIDDGSIDETLETVKKFTDTDFRFKYFTRNKKYKKGLPGCRNQGLDVAKGKYIVFFDDDDISHPQLLELALINLSKKKYDFCRYERSTFRGKFEKEFEYLKDSNTREITIQNLDAIIKNELPFNSCQVVWKKSSISNERFEESLMFAEEWEFYTRLLLKGLKGISIDKVLYFGRKHPESNTGEFFRRNPVRINSQNKAAILIIKNLNSKDLFTEKHKIFFLRMGFNLKSLTVIKRSLDAAGSNSFEKLKYQLGYKFYPFLKPIFHLKSKILKN